MAPCPLKCREPLSHWRIIISWKISTTPLFKNSRQALGPTLPPIQWVTGPLGIKRPGREAGLYPLPSTVLRMLTSSRRVSPRHARDNYYLFWRLLLSRLQCSIFEDMKPQQDFSAVIIFHITKELLYWPWSLNFNVKNLTSLESSLTTNLENEFPGVFSIGIL